MIEKVTMKEAEGALNKVNELEYVRGLDKDGNPISINKEDLATVLGGLLPKATPKQDGLMPSSYYRVFNRKLIGLSSNKTVVVGEVYGLLYVCNQYINEGIGTLYACGLSSVEKIWGKGYDLDFVVKNGVLNVTSRYEITGTFEFLFQNLYK